MDLIALTRPLVRDREGLQDFADALKDHVHTVEQAVAKLRKTPDDKDIVSELFRAVHNIKGDATLCRLDIAVLLAHPIETLLARLRSGEIALSESLAETLLLSMDRLELATAALQHTQPIEALNLATLVQGLESLSRLAGRELEASCANLIESVTGFRPARALPAVHPLHPPRHGGTGHRSHDLVFFRQLARQLDAKSPLFHGRSDRILRLAIDTNDDAGNPVDPIQLEAACHFHDIGMMFLSDGIWLKSGMLTEQDRVSVREHPILAADLLKRISGWDEAAQIVLQHHEMQDGHGYPAGLAGESICLGAKLLAIIDAFEAVMLKQSHRSRNRSVLRAVAEVNASSNQFATVWMGPFNRVIRNILERA